MTLKQIYIILCLFVSFITPALARIGETREECKKRYGLPINKLIHIGKENEYLVFEKAEFEIEIHFYQNKADQVVYWKTSRTNTISEHEANELMTLNGGKKKWVIPPKDENPLSWTKVTEDKSLMASYWNLMLSTPPPISKLEISQKNLFNEPLPTPA